jgi:hypothetical protein
VPARLGESHAEYYVQQAAGSQRTAWSHEVAVLATAFGAMPQAVGWGLVMEYELPFEGGRRVDKITLAGKRLLALEFKEATRIYQADVDQVRAYARDLAEYHSASRELSVEPILVLPNIPSLDARFGDARVVGMTELPSALAEASGPDGVGDIDTWLTGSYSPLPTLVEAAKRVFRDEPLPAIRRAHSAGIPELLNWLIELVEEARTESTRHLVVIRGVPGSGKTLVGLQFVHELGGAAEAAGLFLSGNGPLVQLLQHVLGSKVFVRPMRNFVLEYGVRKHAPPAQHVLVFDEAQRAWGAAHVHKKHSHDRSEPQILLDIASSLPGWAVVVALIGEGQEIHLGEEEGIVEWNHSIRRTSGHFRVHVPERIAEVFTTGARGPLDLESIGLLDLDTSLRPHRAGDVHEWVRRVLEGEIERASELAGSLRDAGFDVYVTGDLLRAKSYVWARYADSPQKRYGLVASSKAKNLIALGIDNEYFAMRRFRVGPWFSGSPEDPGSSCRLTQPATEFQCQGLELDLPVLCWGDDLRWLNERWESWHNTRGARNSRQLRINSYRVLLTRGRDGVVVFVPGNLPNGQQEAVTNVLLNAGASALRT